MAKIFEIKKKSVIPIYGIAAACVLYCLIFPLYRTWHFVVLACLGALVFIVLSVIFPGKTEYIEIPEEPERTGEKKVDDLLAEGEKAVEEMTRLKVSLPDEAVRQKLSEIIDVIDKIFKKMIIEPGAYPRVKRFADFYLPTTIKLLHTYDRLGQSGLDGENITGTVERIDAALDTILASYKKFFDSLFDRQALDIETDIRVLESMLRNEGLMDSEFKTRNKQ